MTKSSNEGKKLLSSNIFWGIFSVALSIVLWFYITGTLKDVEEVPYENIEVQFVGADTLQESMELVVTESSAQTVSVKISATRATHRKLSEDSIKAVVDLTKFNKEGSYMAAYTLTYPDNVNRDEIDESQKTPDFIQLTLSKLVTIPVPVRGSFMGSTAEGYVAEDLIFEPATVNLTGPETELKNIGSVWVTLGGDDVTRTRTVDVPYTYMDKDNNVLDYTDITADFDTISVTQPISLRKDVVLTVDLIEGAGANSTNTIVTVEPRTITISGDSTIVAGINMISLETIDLTDFPFTMEKTIPIILENGVKNVTGTSEATVTIEVVGLATKRFSVNNITYTNLPDGYSAELLTKSLDVTIRGREDVLSKIKAGDIQAVADLTDYNSRGDISVPVKISVKGYDAGAIGDYNVTINLK